METEEKWMIFKKIAYVWIHIFLINQNFKVTMFSTSTCCCLFSFHIQVNFLFGDTFKRKKKKQYILGLYFKILKAQIFSLKGMHVICKSQYWRLKIMFQADQALKI